MTKSDFKIKKCCASKGIKRETAHCNKIFVNYISGKWLVSGISKELL